MAGVTAPSAMSASWAFVGPELLKEDTARTSFSTDVGSEMTSSTTEQASSAVVTDNSSGSAVADPASVDGAASQGWCWVVPNPGQIVYSTPPKREQKPRTPPQPVLDQGKLSALDDSPGKAGREDVTAPVFDAPAQKERKAAAPAEDRDIAGAVVNLVTAAACGCFSGLTTCLANRLAASMQASKEKDVDSEYIHA